MIGVGPPPTDLLVVRLAQDKGTEGNLVEIGSEPSRNTDATQVYMVCEMGGGSGGEGCGGRGGERNVCGWEHMQLTAWSRWPRQVQRGWEKVGGDAIKR